MQLSKIDLTDFQSSELTKICNFFAPYTKRIYLVGGCVRDYFLGIKSKDFDIEVYDVGLEKFQILMKKLGAAGTGKNFFVYKYGNFDISLPRTESKVGVGHRAFDVEICNDEKIASKRRDFTMNALMLNPFSGEILDFWGGISDIKKGKIKIVCGETFKQDSLRVLRAVQFAARFNFTIDKKTFEIMKTIGLDDLSKDRIRVELIKLFNADFQHIGFSYIYRLNLCEFLFTKHISADVYGKIHQILKNGRKFVKNEMFFLYIFLNLSGANGAKMLKNLNLSSSYKRILKEPFCLKATKRFLGEVALKMPLSKWLGLYTKKRVCMAKKLQIYDKKFDPKINTKNLLEQGFYGIEMAKEIKRLENLALKRFLITPKDKM